MKTVLDSWCFGTKFEETDDTCVKKCYAAAMCKADTEKWQKSLKTRVSRPCTVEEHHEKFLKELNELFPRMREQRFESRGCQHEFFSEQNILVCRVKTVFPDYAMLIDIGGREPFVLEKITTDDQMESYVIRIKEEVGM